LHKVLPNSIFQTPSLEKAAAAFTEAHGDGKKVVFSGFFTDFMAKNGHNRTPISEAQGHLFYSTRLKLMPINHLSERCDASILAARKSGIDEAF